MILNSRGLTKVGAQLEPKIWDVYIFLDDIYIASDIECRQRTG